jgi:adenylate kinase
LQARGYPQAKIDENVEAETLDIILCEAVETIAEDHCVEIDTTHASAEETARIVADLLSANIPPDTKYKIGAIDWSEELLGG